MVGPAQIRPCPFTAEGVLKEALVRLWEQARAKKVENIGVLTLRMFEAGDAFRLLGAVGARIRGGPRASRSRVGYETRESGSFEFEFRGPVSDAQPVKEFLEPQLRDASSKSLDVGFQLTFTEGLSMQGDMAEKLTERLSRFASGAAYVSGHSGGQGLRWHAWRESPKSRRRNPHLSTSCGCAVMGLSTPSMKSGRCPRQPRRR